MPLLDLKDDRYTSHGMDKGMDKLPERFRRMEHHDLLVDVLREELEESVRQVRALAGEPGPQSYGPRS